jgi:hypothetical protein
MTPFCLCFSGGSHVKESDDEVLDVVLMFNGGPLGTRGGNKVKKSKENLSILSQ